MQDGTRSLGIIALLPLISILPRMVGAVYLIAFNKLDCIGDGLIINKVVPGICYDLFFELNVVPNSGIALRSVSFVGSPVLCEANAYVQPYCSKTDPAALTGVGAVCLSSPAPTGLSSAGVLCPADTCFDKLLRDQMTPAQVEIRWEGVVHTEDANAGYWILETADAKELFSQLTKVAPHEKVEWLRSQGAAFQPVLKL